MDHPFPWFKDLAADDLDDQTIEFKGMHVESPSGEHLGDVDGFIVDSDSGRPYYVVVDAGGWFRSKHFLLPVGHASFDADDEVLKADLTRAHVHNFPGFKKDEFEKLTADELRRFNDETCRACAIEGVAIVYTESEPLASDWDRPDFRNPEWWREPVRSGRDRSSAPEVGTGTAYTERADRSSRERETVVASGAGRDAEVSGRAQPGDVIGVESGGEQTHVGDTAEDEDKRRRDAEKKDANNRRS